MKKFIFCFVFFAIFFSNTTLLSADIIFNTIKSKIPEQTIEENIIYYDIPLNRELQKFVQEECIKYNISETLVYAIMYKESKFEQNIISSTNDHGLLQINYYTFNYINKKFFNNELNISNQKDRIKASVFYLNYIRNYWQNKGLCEENVFKSTVISYNLGIDGATNFVKKHGYICLAKKT